MKTILSLLFILTSISSFAQTGFLKTWYKESANSNYSIHFFSEKNNELQFIIDGNTKLNEKMYLSGVLNKTDLNKYIFKDKNSKAKIEFNFFDAYNLKITQENCSLYFGDNDLSGYYNTEEKRTISELFYGNNKDSINTLITDLISEHHKNKLNAYLTASQIFSDTLNNTFLIGANNMDLVIKDPEIFIINKNNNWQIYIREEDIIHRYNHRYKIKNDRFKKWIKRNF